jgi:hypothetical protein
MEIPGIINKKKRNLIGSNPKSELTIRNEKTTKEPVNTHLQLLVCFGKVGGAIKGQPGLQQHASSGKSQRVRVGCKG